MNAQNRHIAKMNRIAEMDRMVQQREIDSRMPVIKCPLGCGQNHGLNEFNWECRACIMQAGRTVLFTDLDNSMPMLTQIWKRKLNEEKGNEYKATMLIVCRQELKASEAKVSELQINLQALEAQLQSTETKSETNLKTSEAKVSELQIKLQALEAQLQSTETKSETNLKTSEAKVSELQIKPQALEAQLQSTQTTPETVQANMNDRKPRFIDISDIQK
jgi:predicted nuclease with TOPRIM domain